MDTPAAGTFVPSRRLSGDRRTIMSDFYGIEPGTIPGFAETGAGRFMSVGGLPEQTVEHMLKLMDSLRGMHRADGHQDRPARSPLNGGDAPPVEHYESPAVSAAQHAVRLREGGDDAFHD